jgi:hypothetical protein
MGFTATTKGPDCRTLWPGIAPACHESCGRSRLGVPSRRRHPHTRRLLLIGANL